VALRGASQEASGKETSAEEREAHEAEARKVKDEEGRQEREAADAAQAAATADATQSPADAAAEASPGDKLRKELADLEEKAKSTRNDVLLSLATFENEKKQHLKEVESKRRRATENFARRMVGLQHKLDAAAADGGLGSTNVQASSSSASADSEQSPSQALREGVTMVQGLFGSILGKFGVTPITPELGTPLVTPNHETVGTFSGECTFPQDSVAEVVERGFVLETAGLAPVVLQKAKVRLASGGPPTPPPPTPKAHPEQTL